MTEKYAGTPQNLQSKGIKSVHYLRHYIGSWSSFKIDTARRAAEWPVQSLILDRDIGLTTYAKIIEATAAMASANVGSPKSFHVET
jgi:hypothetical protein